MWNKETVIDGCRVYVENGEVNTILSEEIQKNGGYMPLETAKRLTLAEMELLMRSDLENGNVYGR